MPVDTETELIAFSLIQAFYILLVAALLLSLLCSIIVSFEYRKIEQNRIERSLHALCIKSEFECVLESFWFFTQFAHLAHDCSPQNFNFFLSFF